MRKISPQLTSKSLLYFIALLIFSNNLLWMFSLPFNAGPDEYDHYLICRFISKEGRPPIFAKDLPAYWMSFFTKLPVTKGEVLVFSSLPEEKVYPFSYQPRLFPDILEPHLSYLISAALIKLGSIFTKDTMIYLYMARFVSVLCGVFVAVLTFYIAKKLFPDRDDITFLSTIFVGTLPQFTLISSYLSQDAFTAMASSLVFLAWLKCLEGWKITHVALLGIALGLVVSSKINGFVTLIMTLLFLLLFLRQQWKEKTRIFITIFLCVIIVSGWFFLWNYLTYGHPWPRHLILFYAKEFMADTPQEILKYSKVGVLEIGSLSSWSSFIYFNFISFWGFFGWLNIFMPKPNYIVALGLVVFSCVGLIREFFSFSFRDFLKQKESKVLGLMFLCVPLIFIMSAVNSTLTFSPQGRYFFPAIVPIAIVFSWGLLAITQKETFRKIIFIGAITVLAILNLSSYFFCLVKVFYNV